MNPGAAVPADEELTALEDGGEPAAILDAYVAAGLCAGARLDVVVDGEHVLGHSAGVARPGEPMSERTKVRLDCASKPVMAMGIAILEARGALGFQDPVARFLPEFAESGKGSVTLHHILTHTAGIYRPPDSSPYRTDYATLVKQLASQPIDYREPGEAVYDAWGGWFVLSEVVRKVSGLPWYDFLAKEVLAPLGCGDFELVPNDATGLELPHRWHAGRLFPMLYLDRPEILRYENPAYGGYAPLSSLLRLYTLLADRDRCFDVLGFDADLMRRPQRPRMHDHAVHFDCSVGYGMLTDLGDWNYADAVSAEAFGHHSDAGTWAFYEPRLGMAAAIRVNGLPERLHTHPSRNPRGNPVVGALYRSLA